MATMQPSFARTVRIFISSTFEDMHPERDFLVRRVFPALRSRCRDRQVELVEVDLRWGITRRQAEKGETLPRCLDMIHECRPFFLGIIGDRYGWIPDRRQIPDYLLHDQPWLKEHLDKSVTELEILHGVLNNPEMNDRAFFYFRDLAKPGGRVVPLTDGREQREKLDRLKRRIVSSNYPVTRYRSLKELGDAVIENLWKAIDSEYPPFSISSDESRWDLENASFIANRLSLYTPRDEVRARLESHIESSTVPLVLVGDSGGGKSAILAEFVFRSSKQHPEYFVLAHFVGVSQESARPHSILRKFIGGLKARFGFDNPLPESDSDLPVLFDVLLGKASAMGRIVLVIDALNQIVQERDVPLSWLPVTLPANVRAIFSTTPESTQLLSGNRDLRIVRLEPPDQEMVRKMIADYLQYYGKTMEQGHVERISRTPQTQNPLFLRVLLDELRVTARFENVKNTLSGYLKAKTTAEIFDRMLSRWERDFNYPNNDLVQDALSLLAVSGRGLSERELLEILGDRDKNRPLPQARWAPFFHSARSYLLNRSGLLWFFHDHMRQAVERRYLASPEDRCNALFRLTDYYCEQISRNPEHGGTYRGLSVEVAEDSVRWAEKSQDLRLQAQACLQCSGALLSAAVGVSDSNVVHFNRMVALNNKGCKLARKAGAKDIEADALCRRAVDETLANPDFGNFDLLDESIRLRRKSGDTEGVRDTLRDKARIGMRLNRLDITETCLTEADSIQAHLESPDPQWTNIHQHQYWGECLGLQGRWAEAVERFNLALSGARKFRHFAGKTVATGWLGLAECHLGNKEKGLRMVCTAMDAECNVLQSQEGVAKWLVELGRVFVGQGDTEGALHALWLAEGIYQELQHTALRWARQLLNGIAERAPADYANLKKAFNPFAAEYSSYCSLWGLPPFSLVDDDSVRVIGATDVIGVGFTSSKKIWTIGGGASGDHKKSIIGVLHPEKINGVFWLYLNRGDSIYAACSYDRIHWEMIPRPVIAPRAKHFDSLSVAPGPVPIQTPEGLLLVYGAEGIDAEGRRCSAVGQALLDPMSPTRVLRRSFQPLLLIFSEDRNEPGNSGTMEVGEVIDHREGWFLPLRFGNGEVRFALAKRGNGKY